MTRWEPNARGRLEQAALELFEQRGYDRTTVHDIAVRAGVTKRTFFRHFSDKREVLFSRAEEFKLLFVDSLAAVPVSATSLEAVGLVLARVGADFPRPKEYARRRQLLINANPDLLERERSKLAAVAAALGTAFRDRGSSEPTATLTAETTVTVFRIAFERWVEAPDPATLPELIDESLATLRAIAQPLETLH